MHESGRIFVATGLISLAIAGVLQSPAARAQSTDTSQISAISVEPSEASAATVLEVLPAGSKLVVTALRPIGDVVELSVETASAGVAISIKVSTATVRAAGITVGSVLVTTATSAGILISVGTEAVAFIPNALCRSLIHQRGL